MRRVELEEARKLALKRGQASAAVQCSMGKAKLLGLIIDRREVGDAGAFDALTDEELVSEAAKKARELGIAGPHLVEDGSKAGMATPSLDVRFTPKSGHDRPAQHDRHRDQSATRSALRPRFRFYRVAIRPRSRLLIDREIMRVIGLLVTRPVSSKALVASSPWRPGLRC